MTPCVRWLSVLGLFVLPIAVLAQPKREAIVIFKDGFDIKGRVNEKVRDFIWDKDSGRSFPILSGQFFLDDDVREIFFSPNQVTKVYQPKVGEVQEPMRVWRMKSVYQVHSILPEFRFDTFSKWDDKGARTVEVINTARQPPKNRIEMKQKVALVTPHYVHVVTYDYKWDQMYFTDEFGPDLTRKILLQIFSEKKDLRDLTDAAKQLKIAEFMQQTGWFKETERELKSIIENCPAEKKIAEEMLDKLNREKANLYVDEIEKLASVGQHSMAMTRLEVYDREEMKKLVRPALTLKAADAKAKYAKAKTDIELAKGYLQKMPALTKKSTETWTKATEFIVDELNPDTIDRLDTFLLFAQQHEADRKANKKPTQTAEEVLALAVTGWLQGKQAAEPDVKVALNLARGRDFLVEYLTTENPVKRASLLSEFTRINDVPIDVMTRLVRMIPPVAHDDKQIDAKVQTLTTADGSTYCLKLPPDYHHQRSYPVMILMASSRDDAEETLKRFADEAAKFGFILAAPQWNGNSKKVVKGKAATPGAKEQQMVLDTLADLRRRFQVDSDRVFLFGWEDGGGLAFDVGLGHPDLFAGVIPMNGGFTLFTKRYYWPNVQYLPLYIVEGERNAANAKLLRETLKDCWTRDPYSCIYVEYRGRGSEWFGLEIPKIMNWASRKKRYTPMKEMGRANFTTSMGEEFHSSRNSDNRFYWLSCESIAERCLLDLSDRKLPFTAYRPATFQANLGLVNRAKKGGAAEIWNEANVRVSGAKKLTLWITPGMMDTTKPLSIRLNGQEVGGRRTITPSLETMLEELYRTGDRQRLFVAKVDL